jgi:phospholipid/cholesterol/gamma-HCH transport system permease protein
MSDGLPVAEEPGAGWAAAVTRRVSYHGTNLGYRVRNQFVWLGEMLVFVVKVVRAVPTVLRHHRRELWRLIAEVTFGGGILAIAASTILVSALLASVVGVQLGIEGLQGLNIIGLAPLAGLLSAFANTRELSPLLAGYGLAAQMGCRFTAQIGAMKVNEEIDALEVMSIPSLPYLVTTRLLAALVAVVPLYLLALSGAYLATEFAVLTIAHQGSGTYLH